ncbi:MAG: hypothetical protein ABJA98_27895 [Acidobacteriota bacterium]
MSHSAPDDLAVERLRQVIAAKAKAAPPGSPEQQRLLDKLQLADEALLDDIYSHVDANPDRVGCPPQAVLVELATRVRPVTDPLWEHVIHCSPCTVEVRTRHRARSGATWFIGNRRQWATAAVLVLGTVSALLFLPRRHAGELTEASAPGTSVPTTLDLRKYAVSRSEVAPPRPEPLRLPRRRLSLTMLLPIGSEPGPYELQLLDANLQSRSAAAADAMLRDFVTRLTADLDVRSVPPGAYQLAIRRTGEDWQLFPARVD